MSFINLKKIGDAQKKPAIVDVRSGDTVRVTQKIKEGNKFRSQVFEGVVIRTDRKGSHTARITVRKVASGVGVEKSFLIHNPLVEKIEIVHRAKVRRKNLSFLRNRSGKSTRLTSKNIDRETLNKEISTKVEETEDKAKEVIEKVADKAEAAAKDLAEKAEEIKEAVSEKAEEAKDVVADKIADAKEAATEKIEEVKEKAEKVKEVLTEDDK